MCSWVRRLPCLCTLGQTPRPPLQQCFCGASHWSFRFHQPLGAYFAACFGCFIVTLRSLEAKTSVQVHPPALLQGWSPKSNPASIHTVTSQLLPRERGGEEKREAGPPNPKGQGRCIGPMVALWKATNCMQPCSPQVCGLSASGVLSALQDPGSLPTHPRQNLLLRVHLSHADKETVKHGRSLCLLLFLLCAKDADSPGMDTHKPHIHSQTHKHSHTHFLSPHTQTRTHNRCVSHTLYFVLALHLHTQYF